MKTMIKRYLCDSGNKPYYLECNMEKTFSTLKELRDFYAISKIIPVSYGWAINSKGKKIEWKNYECDVDDMFIRKIKGG
jgi:hypothetical protein